MSLWLKELDLEAEVDFLGRISREEMQKEMQKANCFVLPTRYEAFGVVLIEAMASGLPVIATRSGGPDSIVTQENGFLIDPNNAEQLTLAMEQMISRHKTFSASKIRSQTLRLYGQTAVMKRYDDLFKEILQE